MWAVSSINRYVNRRTGAQRVSRWLFSFVPEQTNEAQQFSDVLRCCTKCRPEFLLSPIDIATHFCAAVVEDR